jgi:tetratricopeptide (TPR) repeat protein
MAHPDFSPFQLPLIQVKSHILAVALRGLDEQSLKILQTLAAFRMPVGYHTLVDLFVEEEKSFDAEDAFITLLTDLEDRGLLGWDRRANRYDLHPIVRGVIWSHMVHQDKKMIYKTLKTHFQSVSMREEEREIRSLEDLAPIIELYNVLIGLRHFEDAFNLYWDRLNKLMVYHLSALRQVKELLELFFLDGLDQPPRLESPHAQSRVLNSLALSSRDQLEQAIDLKWRSAEIDQQNANWLNVSVNLSHLSGDLCLSGRIYEAETSARRALMIAKQQENNNREAVALGWLGSVLTKRGRRSVSWRVLQRSLCISHDGIARGVYTSSDDTSIRVNEAFENDPEIELKRASCYHLAWLHPGYFFLAIYFLQYGQYSEAQEVARKHRILSEQGHYERGVIRAIRIQGAALLGLEELSAAEGHFHEALVRARKANLVEEELASLVGLSELHRRQGNLKAAREYLDDTWEAAEYGSFRLLQVDAWNILAQIECDARHRSAAVEAALRAYRSAWCDGPPFTYYWGLEVAKSHLCALGVPEPIMPAFDPVQYKPMPDVEIDPLDEFYVGEMQ